MKLIFKHLNKSLRGILNFVWYAGIAVSAITFIATVMFLFASSGSFDSKIPAISFSAGNLSYRFNTKYLEVINIEEIARRSREEELGRVWKLRSREWWVAQAYESLYDMKFPPLPNYLEIKLDENTPVSIRLDNCIQIHTPQIFEITNVNVFPIAFSLLVISFVFFGMMILFNVRRILNVKSAENLFSMNSSKCIKYIGFYILLSEFVRVLLLFWMNGSIMKMFNYSEFWGNKITTVTGSYFVSWSDVNYWIVFVGLITLLISEVLKTGALLKEDVDLTI